eukprot:735219-Rhodomonas_salina.1
MGRGGGLEEGEQKEEAESGKEEDEDRPLWLVRKMEVGMIRRRTGSHPHWHHPRAVISSSEHRMTRARSAEDEPGRWFLAREGRQSPPTRQKAKDDARTASELYSTSPWPRRKHGQRRASRSK